MYIKHVKKYSRATSTIAFCGIKFFCENTLDQLIQDGRLPAQKVGHIYVIDAAVLKIVKRKKPGRPRTKKPVAKKR